MNSETVLFKIAGLHGVLLGIVGLALAVSGYAARDLLLGGFLMGAVYGLLWGIVKNLVVKRRRRTVTLLGITKIAVYVVLGVILLQGGFTVDAAAFAGGVICFVVAVVATVCMTSFSGKPGTA